MGSGEFFGEDFTEKGKDRSMVGLNNRGFGPSGVIFCPFFTFAAVALVGAMCPAATTVVLFDNFGPGGTYNVNASESLTWGKLGSDWIRYYDAVSFVPDRTANLDRVELALSLPQGYNEVDILLFADNGGLPGGTLETIHLNDKIPANDGIVHLPVVATSVARPELVAGRTYWIGVAPGATKTYTNLYWHSTVSGATQPSAQNFTKNGTWLLWKSKSFACVMRVVGGYSGCARPRSDLNGDCKVDLADLAILAEDWLKCGRENPADC
jgi:hypothetical protein